MSELERIQRYIDKTKLCENNYDLCFNEWLALCRRADEQLADTVALAFNYGRAKGYRAAKAETARG